MNKYTKQFSLAKSLYPKVYSVVKDLPNEYIYNENYSPSLRHPGAILNRATHEIIETFNKSLTSFGFLTTSDFSQNKVPRELDNILKLMEALFGYFDSFLDECFIILKCLCNPPAIDKGASTKYVHEWLKLNGFSCGANFYSYTSNIQKYINFFSNRLKHANQCFDGFVAKINGLIIPGFYIQEVLGKDFKEFFPKLPNYYTGKVIAFSFNKTLKNLILCFYEICDALEKTIKQHIKEKHGVKFDTKHSVVHDKIFENILDKLSVLGNYYYPYEFIRFVDIRKSDNIFYVKYPHRDRCPYTGQLHVVSTAKGDGYTKSFPLVYC